MARIIGRTVNAGEVEFVNKDDGTIVLDLHEQQPAIADLTVAPTAADHNAVLAVLREYGLIAT